MIARSLALCSLLFLRCQVTANANANANANSGGLPPVVLLSNDNLERNGVLEARSLQEMTEFVNITLGIQFDASPGDIHWDLTIEGGSQRIAYSVPGLYNIPQLNGVLGETSFSLIKGKKYRFTIYDSVGNGLAPPGYYYMAWGKGLKKDYSNVIFLDQRFRGDKYSTVFTADVPPTRSPTTSRTPTHSPSTSISPTISPAPTHAPTSCVGSQRFIESNTFNSKPMFTTAAVTFPNNNLCTKHTSYATCTNEIGDDCQWIFLSSSVKKGICRIDPISKCLQTGDCICQTEDFHGGTSVGNGVIFHAPISITRRDISRYNKWVTYKETYTQPSAATQNPLHPLDDDFFISKVDFTARQLQYTFSGRSPVLSDLFSPTIAFKTHFLYMDTPLIGRIWDGVGIVVDIDSLSATLTVNKVTYTLPKLKMWTCTQILITPNKIYIAGIGIDRILSKEVRPAKTTTLVLGEFAGELFDVRIYTETLTYPEIREVGARCTGPNDPAALKATRDIDILYARDGCKSPHGGYFSVPLTGGQTYGSGAFATFWVRPGKKGDVAFDIPEGKFDEEHFFQQKKLQNYLWEKYYFENDMIAFNLKPYRYFSEAEIPQFAQSTWNNPCRFMHQYNNLWSYPIYGDSVLTKWTVEDNADSPDDVFDLATIFRQRNFPGYDTIAHETFHEFTGSLYLTYASDIGPDYWWLSESTASFAAAYTFPAMIENFYIGFALAIAFPLGFCDRYECYEVTNDGDTKNSHFLTPELSINANVRGGHIYGSWRLWWFLAEYADMPHVVGQIMSLQRRTGGQWNGKLHSLRMLVEAENLDLGDVWGVLIAHQRTWDFGETGAAMAKAEERELAHTKQFLPGKIPSDVELEKRKTTVELNSRTGTRGNLLAGPVVQRPGPFGWNCLTARDVQPNRFVSISIQWDDGMGFPANTEPAMLPTWQSGCDEDTRFYNSMVVMHNTVTGSRQYWKLKGKRPSTLHIKTGDVGLFTIHILLVPTPPTDYVGATDLDKEVKGTVPIYSYKYSVTIRDSMPNGVTSLSQEVSKRSNGIVAFDKAKPGWWPIRCTCIFEVSSGLCMEPTFQFKTNNPFSFCFSGENSVDVKGRGTIPMASLQLGDEVLVGSGKYEAVYSFGHRHETTEAYFLHFLPSGLELSADHMVKVGGHYIPAAAVRVGDLFETATPSTLMLVESIETVKRKGVYAPFTMSGTIMVNNVKASSYVSFQGSDRLMIGGWRTPWTCQWLAHMSQGPHRMWIRLFGIGEEVYAEDGMSAWIHLPHGLGQWYLEQSSIVMLVLLVPILAFSVAVAAFDAIYFCCF